MTTFNCTNYKLNGEKFSFLNQIPIFLPKDSASSCLQHVETRFLESTDLTCLLGTWVAATPSVHLGLFSSYDL
jgi:hypothetical protein